MSTTFGIEIEENNKIIVKPVARRTGAGNGKVNISWNDPLYRFIRPEKDVIAMDNTQQGIYTIKDLLMKEFE